MPPTGRRRARKEPVQDPSDADTTDMLNTPSRKRRRTNGANTASKAARVSRAESVGSDGTVAQDNLDDEETAFAKQMAFADRIIPKLRTAQYQVNAALLYANEHNKTTPAFARMSGKDWTYFVMETEFTIGRPVRPAKAKIGGSTSPALSDGVSSGADFPVQIDLGPDQQVSRVHALVTFVGEQEAWKITVNGRNGLLIDDRRFEKGQESWLHSGAVICILGTQMMFTLPQGPMTIHSSIIAQAADEGGETEDEYTEDRKAPGPDRSSMGGARQNGSSTQAAQSRGYDASANQHHQYSSHPMSNPDTPLTVRSKEAHLKSKPSPAYGRGLVLETTEDIDYAADSARDIKPPHSYAQLIGQAIVSSPEEKLTLAKIYDFIKEHYAFYRFSGGGWQNSIRHNLSLSKSFEKVARRTDEPGKGMKWQIVPEQREEFLKKNLVYPRKAVVPVAAAGPESPLTGVRGPSTASARPARSSGAHQFAQGNTKASPRGDTPPLGSYPTATESFTPDRGPRAALGHHDGMPALVNGGSTTETPQYLRSSAAANVQDAGGAASFSPPDFGPNTTTKRHGLGLFGEFGNSALPLQTPLGRAKVHLAPPSTAQLPSQHMLFSSPAPFWKYADLGSTPARPLEGWESPDKKAAADDGDAHAEADETMLEGQPTVDLGADHDDMKDEGDSSRPATAEGDAASKPQASSPPVPTAANDKPADLTGLEDGSADEVSPIVVAAEEISPSRTISRPVSRQLPGQAPPQAINSAPLPKLNFGNAPVLAATSGNSSTGPQRATAMPQMALPTPPPQRRSFGGLGDEEEGIDLAKPMQRIGSFHRARSFNAAQSHGLGITSAQPHGLMAPRS